MRIGRRDACRERVHDSAPRETELRRRVVPMRNSSATKPKKKRRASPSGDNGRFVTLYSAGAGRRFGGTVLPVRDDIRARRRRLVIVALVLLALALWGAWRELGLPL